MLETKQEQLVKTYGLLPFKVLALDVKRTLCEKIMSLVRFSSTANPIDDLNKKIRHTYDINQLLKDKNILKYFNTSDFDKMLIKVAQDDVISFKNNNTYLKVHPAEALIFAKPKETWNQLKKTYNGSFKTLVFGKFPDENDILNTIKFVANRLQKINWQIDMVTNNE